MGLLSPFFPPFVADREPSFDLKTFLKKGIVAEVSPRARRTRRGKRTWSGSGSGVGGRRRVARLKGGSFCGSFAGARESRGKVVKVRWREIGIGNSVVCKLGSL